MVRFRDLRCPTCGDVRQVSELAVLVFCSSCGGLADIDTEAALSGPTQQALLDRAAALVEGRTELDSIEAELAKAMEQAQRDGDRAAWRALATDYYTVLAFRGGNDGAGPEGLRPWMQRNVDATEVMLFDPEVQAAAAAYTGAMAPLMTASADDAPDVVREVVRLATDYFDCVIDHPDVPEGLYEQGASHHARLLVKGMVEAWGSFLQPDVLRQIRLDVFEEQEISERPETCPSCGALFPAGTGDVTCQRCGSVFRIS